MSALKEILRTHDVIYFDVLDSVNIKCTVAESICMPWPSNYGNVKGTYMVNVIANQQLNKVVFWKFAPCFSRNFKGNFQLSFKRKTDFHIKGNTMFLANLLVQ